MTTVSQSGSLITMGAPRRTTRTNSARACAGSARCWKIRSARQPSKTPSGNSSCGASPRRNSIVAPATSPRRRASVSSVSLRSTPTTRPPGATIAARARTSVPVPHPTSRRVSPGRGASCAKLSALYVWTDVCALARSRYTPAAAASLERSRFWKSRVLVVTVHGCPPRCTPVRSRPPLPKDSGRCAMTRLLGSGFRGQ